MRIYNRYIITLTTILMLSTVILLAIGQNSLATFFTIYVIEALMLTELYVHFNSRARRGLGIISSFLFIAFILILSLEAIKILS